MKWNRCDICGKFIAIDDFVSGKAKTKLISPDSAYSAEEYITECKKCNKKNEKENQPLIRN